jgi:hypothetical protein
MAGMEPTTTMTAIIKAITATITGIAGITETIIGEDGMTGIDGASITCRTHPGDLGEFSGAAHSFSENLLWKTRKEYVSGTGLGN